MTAIDNYTTASFQRAAEKREAAEVAQAAGTASLEQLRLLAHYARPGTHGYDLWREFALKMRDLGCVTGPFGDDDRKAWLHDDRRWVAWAD